MKNKNKKMKNKNNKMKNNKKFFLEKRCNY